MLLTSMFKLAMLLGIYFFLGLFSTKIHPQSVDPRSSLKSFDLSPVLWGGAVNPDLFVVSDQPTQYGRPLVRTKGLPQWVNQAFVDGSRICAQSNYQRDRWYWIFETESASGIYVPEAYHFVDQQFVPECLNRFNDIASFALDNLDQITRVGYNVNPFPSEPTLGAAAGVVPGQGTYYKVNDTGRLIEPNQPAYFILG